MGARWWIASTWSQHLLSYLLNFYLGDRWYAGFLRRHNRLSLKKAQQFPKVREDARDPNVVYDFYDKLEECIEEAQLPSENGSYFVFNCDETAFNLDPTKTRAVGVKGEALHRISGGSGRNNRTVLACVSAAGERFAPLIVYKGQKLLPSWTSEDAYPGTEYVASTKGWMEEIIFYEWLSQTFIPFVDAVRKKFDCPHQHAILIFDGHTSHFSLRILLCALINKIILLKFPSHLTDLLQPLDKAVFSSLKRKWDQILVEYGRKNMGLQLMCLTKAKFVALLG